MKNLIDEEGENRAVRMFLALYGGQCGVTTEQMRKHLEMSGFKGAWPEWAATHNGHLTKAGAQLWIRHLFALEQPAQQEPVAWMYPDDYERMTTSETFCTVFSVECGSPTQGKTTVALYTGPQAREWVGLTESEIIMCSSMSVLRFYDAIEAKLREKNT